MIYIMDTGRGSLRDEPSQFLLAVSQFLRAQILPIRHQQIEGEKARVTAMKEQILERRPAGFTNTGATEMKRDRVGEISAEMSALLEQQRGLLKDRSIARLSVEDLHAYEQRNQRLRDLCNELLKVS